MEKINEFVKELKGRISNPFFSSFIISWLAYNWKIPIGLIFMTTNDLLKESYTSYFTLISNEISKHNSIKYPFLAAIIYTLGYPFLKEFLLVFNSAIQSVGSLGIKKFSSFGMISLNKYFLLRDTYEVRSKLLEKTIQEESKFLQLNESLKNDLLKEQTEKNKLINEKQQLEYFSTPKFLNGEWEFLVQNNLLKENKTLLISDGTVSEIWNQVRDKKVIGRIQNFHYNNKTNEIFFYLNTNLIQNSDIESHFFVLNFNGDLNNVSILTGYLDNKKYIQLNKVD